VQRSVFPLLRWEGAGVEEMTREVQRQAAEAKRVRIDRCDDEAAFAAHAKDHLFITDTWKPLELFQELKEAAQVLSTWCSAEEDGKQPSTSVAIHGPGSVFASGTYFVTISNCDWQSSLAHLALHLQRAHESSYQDFCAVFGNEKLAEERPHWFDRNCRGLEGSRVSLVELQL